MKKAGFGFLFSLLITVNAISQSSRSPIEQVRRYVKQQTANRFDSSLKYLTNRLGIEMHYLYPLYQAAAWEEKFRRNMGDAVYNIRMAQLLAYMGDHSTALEYSQRNYDTLDALTIKAIADTVNKLRGVQYVSAKEAILQNARLYRAIMINESQAKTQHRAFVYGLLADLYKEGYHYFAMEGFNNFSNKYLDSVNVFAGYGPSEPVGGEVTRKALELGFTLLPYEDTLASTHTPAQRDSAQASNLAAIFKKDPTAKICVLAGMHHIQEERMQDLKPMGWWFRQISGIDPFTIDQASMTEGSEFAFGKIFYENFNKRFTISQPSILYRNNRPFNPLEQKGFDVILMHPPTTYQHNRETWLRLGEERQPVLIQPTEKLLFFVQAYYSNEFDSNGISFLIPADQTYISNREGYYCLFLRKGNYKIVMRDISYKILSIKDLEVN